MNNETNQNKKIIDNDNRVFCPHTESAINTVIQKLEPVPFEKFGNRPYYEKFLSDWKAHVTGIDKPVATEQQQQQQQEQQTDGVEEAAPAEQKLSEKRQKVAVSEILQVTCKALDHDIMSMADTKYIFVRTHWRRIPESQFVNFLRKVCIAMGVDRLLAPDINFLEALSKQIDSSTRVEPQGFARNLINFNNGTLYFDNEGSVSFTPHNKKDRLRYALPYGYDSKASCSRWQNFLDEVIPEEGKQQNLAEFFGSCFSAVKHEKIMLLYGSGANGKSVVLEVISRLFGSDNIGHNTLEEITSSQGYFRGELMDVLLNYAGEISSKVNPDGLKKLASGEPMKARYVWGKPFDVKDYCRSAFNCNQLPEVNDTSDGYFRRFLILPFERTIPEEQRNPDLPQEIAATDLPGIMNWVVAGLQRLLLNKGKFSYSVASERILKKYKDEADTVSMFIPVMRENNYDKLLGADLYEKYRAFCVEQELTPLNNKKFSVELRTLGLIRRRVSKGVTYEFRDKYSLKEGNSAAAV